MTYELRHRAEGVNLFIYILMDFLTETNIIRKGTCIVISCFFIVLRFFFSSFYKSFGFNICLLEVNKKLIKKLEQGVYPRNCQDAGDGRWLNVPILHLPIELNCCVRSSTSFKSFLAAARMIGKSTCINCQLRNPKKSAVY